MVFTNAKNTESVQKIQLIDAAKQLLDAAGVDGDLFEDALKTLQVAQEQNLSITNPENKNYIDFEKIKHEIEISKKLFQKYNWPTIDVTRKSVEETAASILKIHDIFNHNE